MKLAYFLTFLGAFACASLQAQEKKQKYNLFHPVPKAAMREMETDRPDITETPITVDAGHLQYESDLFRLEREPSASSAKNVYLFNQAYLKVGLTNSTDLQVVIQSFNYSREKFYEDGSIEHSHGFGDLGLRIKQNLVGNDKGNFLLAVLPYIKFPTSKLEKEERYEGGLLVPMSLKLPNEWKIGMQLEAERLQDDEGNGLHTQLLESLTVSHKIAGKLDGLAETYYTYDVKHHHWSNYLNAALQLEVAKDVKLDAGLNYGIQHDAMKSYFMGLSFRL